MRSDTESIITAGDRRPIGTMADGDAAGRHGLGHASCSARRLINVARFSYNRIGAHAGGDQRLVEHATTASTCRRTSRRRPACAFITVTGFFTHRRRAAAVRQPASTRSRQFTDDLTWVTGRHSMKFGVRYPPRAHGHRLHQPAERRLHVHRRQPRAPATPPRISCSACRRSSAARRRTPRRTATAGCTRLYVQDEFRPVATSR